MKKTVIRALIPALLLGLVAGCAAPKTYRKDSMPSAQPTQPFVIQPTDILPANIFPQPTSLPVYHTVRPKETMWRISKNYHVPMNELMAVNQIRDARQIRIGQRLLIPGVTRSANYNFVMPYLPSANHWQYIVVHHTATRDGNAETINALHLRRGWKEGMGYHFLIDNGTDGRADGQVEVGRRWQRQMDGAHSNKANMNHLGIGISLVGNFSEIQVSEAQLNSLVALTKALQQRYGIPSSRVVGHRDVPGAATECPGNKFPWQRFKQMIEGTI